MIRRRTIGWDREKLYRELWEQPATKVARAYGISDVMLGKICKKLRVPKPGLGYWRRIELGKVVIQPPLPSFPNAPTVTTDLPAGPERFMPETQPAVPVPVPDRLTKPHPLVTSTRRAIKAHGRTDGRGHHVTHVVGTLPVFVSRGQLARALRIMNALIQEVIRRGHHLKSDRGGTPEFVVNEESVSVEIIETSKRIEKHLNNGLQTYKYKPTGRLQLRIRASYGLDATFRDGSKTLIEDKLGNVLRRMGEFAVAARRWRDELDRAENARQVRIRRHLERQEQIRLEKNRLARLQADVAAWCESRRIRAFVRAVKESGRSLPEASAQGDVEAWASWAEKQADRLDPLSESPDSVLDQGEDWEP